MMSVIISLVKNSEGASYTVSAPDPPDGASCNRKEYMEELKVYNDFIQHRCLEFIELVRSKEGD